MAANRFYAVHFPPGRPLGARLHRFHQASIRTIRAAAAPSEWRAVPPSKVRRVAARADAARRWRYEGPGAWSTPLGPLRSLWLRLGRHGRFEKT
jgi:hypothetical protein